MRLSFVFQLLLALKKVHSMGILHCNLKPQNFLLARNRKDKLLLAGFGGIKDEETIVDGEKQTGLFSMYYADANAQAGNYNKESEVYAFGACAHYLIWGQPLFSKHNKQDYLNNKTKSKNASYDGCLLQGIINWCLHDDPA